ncbi:MAG: Crp/Fnr family transcriptional regulator [Flavisolibacter sp.]
MERLLHFLYLIHPLSDELKAYLFRHLKTQEIARNGMLLRGGHICRNVYFIEKGLLRCFYHKGDTEVSSWFMKEGDVIISIESFYQQKESYESIQALEDSVLYYIAYNELQYIYKNFLEFNFIGRVLTEKYHELWAQQLYALRMHTAYERYQWLLKKHAELVLRVPGKFIASYLGIEKTTLSKIKGMKQK